jgi:hypothetical protein
VHSVSYNAEFVQLRRAFSSTITNFHQESVLGQVLFLLVLINFNSTRYQIGSFSLSNVGFVLFA